MKTYKDCKKISLGGSDYCSVIAVGCYDYGEKHLGNQSLKMKDIHFGEDGGYEAYLVEGEDIVIGSHYEKVFECTSWLKIYDDYKCVFKSDYDFNRFEIYRAGNFGTIIRCLMEK